LNETKVKPNNKAKQVLNKQLLIKQELFNKELFNKELFNKELSYKITFVNLLKENQDLNMYLFKENTLNMNK